MEIQALVDEIGRLEEELGGVKREKNEAEAHTVELKHTIACLEESVCVLESKNTELEYQIELVFNERDHLRRQLSTQRKEMRSRLREMECKLVTCEHELEITILKVDQPQKKRHSTSHKAIQCTPPHHSTPKPVTKSSKSCSREHLNATPPIVLRFDSLNSPKRKLHEKENAANTPANQSETFKELQKPPSFKNKCTQTSEKLSSCYSLSFDASSDAVMPLARRLSWTESRCNPASPRVTSRISSPKHPSSSQKGKLLELTESNDKVSCDNSDSLLQLQSLQTALADSKHQEAILKRVIHLILLGIVGLVALSAINNSYFY